MPAKNTAASIVAALLGKTGVVRVSDNYRKICKVFLATPEKAGILHAAACLQTGAVMITNDRHFDKIRKEGVIKVWTIPYAIRELLALR